MYSHFPSISQLAEEYKGKKEFVKKYLGEIGTNLNLKGSPEPLAQKS